MKYLPLIWAALWRKPVSLFLTLASVSVAFTLFGMMVGFNASVRNLVTTADLNRAYVSTRFGEPLPVAYGSQIARVAGVTVVSHIAVIGGYYQDRKNSAFAIMEDKDAPGVLTDFTLTHAQWDQLQKTRDGVFISAKVAARNHLKAGSDYPLITNAGGVRADGSKVWQFHILGVVNDVPRYLNGFTLGNYDYWDESAAPRLKGTTAQFQIRFNTPDVAKSGVRWIDALFANSAVPTNSITEEQAAENGASAGINIPFVTTMVAGAGLFMILFLTGNGIAQSVRERMPEFATLKTLGFPDGGILTLVFAEAAIPCLLGAVIGIGAALAWAQQIPKLIPPNAVSLPPPIMSPGVLSLAFVFALIVALLSTALPAMRIMRLDMAAALSGR